jgi:hypothetical protein
MKLWDRVSKSGINDIIGVRPVDKDGISLVPDIKNGKISYTKYFQKMKKLRKLSFVKFDEAETSSDIRNQYPFKKGKSYIFFGEIPNMPGHCILADPKTGKFFFGYHTDNFIELPENET